MTDVDHIDEYEGSAPATSAGSVGLMQNAAKDQRCRVNNERQDRTDRNEREYGNCHEGVIEKQPNQFAEN